MKVSVVIPSFNRGEKLIDTIESIEKNDFLKKDFEVIIVNDCSTDNTAEVIKKIVKKYTNVKTITNKKNSGPAVSRNNGIKNTSGELVFFTDDDCIVPSNWIKKYFEFFKENKEVYCAGGILEGKNKNIVSSLEKLKDKILGIYYTKEKIGNKEIKTGFTNNCVYRRSAFKEVGYFQENFKVPAGEDLEFCQRVAKEHKIAFVPVIVLHNHNYNWKYLSGLLYKQGLGEMPPEKHRTLILIFKSPKLIFNIIKKIIGYRK